MIKRQPYFFSYLYQDFKGNESFSSIIMNLEKPYITSHQLEQVRFFLESEFELMKVEIISFHELVDGDE